MSEPAFWFGKSDDGGSSAMREQQCFNNVAKNTSDHSGLGSLLAGPEF
jgi:hypothetical protein